MQFRLQISRAERIEFARRMFACSQSLYCQGSSLYSPAFQDDPINRAVCSRLSSDIFLKPLISELH